MLGLLDWTEERVDLLKKMHAEGASGTEIANALGGTSRNAVIGKIHRLKLPRHGKRSHQEMRGRIRAGMAQTQKKIGRPAGWSPQKATMQTGVLCGTGSVAMRDATPSSSGPIPPDETVNAAAMRGPAWKPLPGTTPILMTNHKEGCRWPVEPGAPGFWYCGAPIADRLSQLAPEPVYCEHHRRKSAVR